MVVVSIYTLPYNVQHYKTMVTIIAIVYGWLENYMHPRILGGDMADEDEVTSIQITRETWARLNARKTGPNQTFDDVVQRLLDETEE